jgi:hypothetical protein
MTDPQVEVLLLQGTVTVAYRRQGRIWCATALEFDLVGAGKTPEAAFEELQGVLGCYFEEILKTKGRVRLFNPSEASEWESPRRELYQVAIAAIKSGRSRRTSLTIRNVDEFRRLRDRIAGINLVPIASCA